jgi:hypothetical protein
MGRAGSQRALACRSQRGWRRAPREVNPLQHERELRTLEQHVARAGACFSRPPEHLALEPFVTSSLPLRPRAAASPGRRGGSGSEDVAAKRVLVDHLPRRDGEPSKLSVAAHQEPRESGRLADGLRIGRKLAGVAVHG